MTFDESKLDEDFRNCLELAVHCGLYTISEAVDNIIMHSVMLFHYDEIGLKTNKIRLLGEEFIKQHGNETPQSMIDRIDAEVLSEVDQLNNEDKATQ